MSGAGAVRDVIVVGGGPAGAATAGFLARAGHDVLVLDQARFPRDKVCGESVSPEAWRLLAELGAADAVRALGPHPIRGMRLVAPDGTSFRGDYGPAPEAGFAVRWTRRSSLARGPRAPRCAKRCGSAACSGRATRRAR